MRDGWGESRGGGFTRTDWCSVGTWQWRMRRSFHTHPAYAPGMVRMTVLASGSKGNSTIVASATTRILVDAGLSCRELMKRMRAAGEEPAALDAILITHEHQDHVQGMAVTARKLGIPGVSDGADASGVGAVDDSAEADYVCRVAGAAQSSERRVQSTGAQQRHRRQETGRQEPPPGAEDGNRRRKAFVARPMSPVSQMTKRRRRRKRRC